MLNLEPIKKRQVNAAGSLPERPTPVDPEVLDLGLIYTEDGYCAACGNGHWKGHMPECQIADLVDDVGDLVSEVERLRKIVDGLAADEPHAADWVDVDNHTYIQCAVCEQLNDKGPIQHLESCAYRQACEYRDGA